MAGRQLSHRNQRSASVASSGARIAEGLGTGTPTKHPARVSSSVVTGIAAFICYYSTLLPGLDFGDSASFQTGVGSLTLTPRQAYPLYYALGNVFAWLDPAGPAHAMNLASAVYGALAVGIATWVAAELAGSTVAGFATGLFLAF